MVTELIEEDIIKVEKLGEYIEPRFKKIFDLNNLNELETIYTYKDNDNVIGFIHILTTIDNIEIINLAVSEEFRRQNIASILLDHILSFASKRIILEVRESNFAALKLYNKFNFFEIGRRQNYYKNEDGVVMERSIS